MVSPIIDAVEAPNHSATHNLHANQFCSPRGIACLEKNTDTQLQRQRQSLVRFLQSQVSCVIPTTNAHTAPHSMYNVCIIF